MIGLNVEQRKRVTIGIELAARPELLLFLDEPTSGLDSDTAWSICKLLRKLADNGQAILCTIHKPSGVLLEMFDRLLFLSKRRSLYFGDLGYHAETLTAYFERNGAPKCDPEQNPAEWLLTITGDTPDSTNKVDWAGVWRTSVERAEIKTDILEMKNKLSQATVDTAQTLPSSKYATTAFYRLYMVTKRTFQHDWRTPSYLWAKTLSTLGMVGASNIFSYISFDLGIELPVTRRHLLMASLSGKRKPHFKGYRTRSSPSSF